MEIKEDVKQKREHAKKTGYMPIIPDPSKKSNVGMHNYIEERLWFFKKLSKRKLASW
jgi:hypothetical protein